MPRLDSKLDLGLGKARSSVSGSIGPGRGLASEGEFRYKRKSASRIGFDRESDSTRSFFLGLVLRPQDIISSFFKK